MPSINHPVRFLVVAAAFQLGCIENKVETGEGGRHFVRTVCLVKIKMKSGLQPVQK